MSSVETMRIALTGVLFMNVPSAFESDNQPANVRGRARAALVVENQSGAVRAAAVQGFLSEIAQQPAGSGHQGWEKGVARAETTCMILEHLANEPNESVSRPHDTSR